MDKPTFTKGKRWFRYHLSRAVTQNTMPSILQATNDGVGSEACLYCAAFVVTNGPGIKGQYLLLGPLRGSIVTEF